MADRMTLHKNRLAEFASWLAMNGYVVENPKGLYEVLRARKTDGSKDTVIIFCRDKASPHLTVMDKNVSLVGRFLRDRKE